MQFIESSVMGVRAVYLRLTAGPESPDVCLFPMIHIGSPAYYAEVKRRLEECDVVLFEGVRSFRGWMLTRAYSILTYRKRLGLVLQRDALVVPLLKLQKIHADVSREQLTATWRHVPFHQRVLVLVGAPLYGLWMYLTGTRRSIGNRLSTEELETSRDFDHFEGIGEFETAIRTTRAVQVSHH